MCEQLCPFGWTLILNWFDSLSIRCRDKNVMQFNLFSFFIFVCYGQSLQRWIIVLENIDWSDIFLELFFNERTFNKHIQNLATSLLEGRKLETFFFCWNSNKFLYIYTCNRFQAFNKLAQLYDLDIFFFDLA